MCRECEHEWTTNVISSTFIRNNQNNVVYSPIVCVESKSGSQCHLFFVRIIEIENAPFTVLDTEITPIEVIHFKINVFGYKFKKLAYITDAGFISETEKEKLKDLDFLILNCIRKFDPHPAHFILPDVIRLFEELQPKKLFLTHISHHLGLHDVEDKQLPTGIHLAYDGLELNF